MRPQVPGKAAAGAQLLRLGRVELGDDLLTLACGGHHSNRPGQNQASVSVTGVVTLPALALAMKPLSLRLNVTVFGV